MDAVLRLAADNRPLETNMGLLSQRSTSYAALQLFGTRMSSSGPQKRNANASVSARLSAKLKERFMHRMLVSIVAFACATTAQAAEVKVLTAGAMKAVVLELVPQFEK